MSNDAGSVSASDSGLSPLAQAAQDVMAHRWSNNREAMDALTRLVDVACERAVMDNNTRVALHLLAACVRNSDAKYPTNKKREMVLAALKHADTVLRYNVEN